MPVDLPSSEAQLAVDDDRLLELARRLIAIPTENPPGNERLAAELLADYFADRGWSVELKDATQGRPNVVARIEGRAPGPHLIFDGHLDVVPAGEGWSTDAFTPVIRDGRLIGRGSADMKGGVAAMIAAVEAVQRAEIPLHGSVTLAVVADEEEGGSGTQALVRAGLRGTWAIVPEPTDLRPVIAHKGSANIRVQVRGAAAHASTPEQGINAIDRAGGLIARLGELNARLRDRQHALLGHPTLTVCTIQGGFNDYTVPDGCRLTLNRRLIPSETARDVVAEVQAVLDDYARVDSAFVGDVHLSAFTPPMETDASSPVVLALRSAAKQVLGADPGAVGWSATCDASLLTHGAGLPTVVFGPGSIAHDAHRPDESVAVADLTRCARIFASTIVHLLARTTYGGAA